MAHGGRSPGTTRASRGRPFLLLPLCPGEPGGLNDGQRGLQLAVVVGRKFRDDIGRLIGRDATARDRDPAGERGTVQKLVQDALTNR